MDKPKEKYIATTSIPRKPTPCISYNHIPLGYLVKKSKSVSQAPRLDIHVNKHV